MSRRGLLGKTFDFISSERGKYSPNPHSSFNTLSGAMESDPAGMYNDLLFAKITKNEMFSRRKVKSH